ncbi:MAG: septum site-determining protein MinC [Desulfotomaculaceae bacterium]|nr:septum site-determining protein MinC [Desulfotomaculaceae bacterium]MDD4767288.1 septum site-determining protein MinC [Desulfotomaculaceae bacterium]
MSSDLVSIKGTRNGLLILLDPNRDYEEIRQTLMSKMESARGFFKGAKFSISQGPNEIPIKQKDELVNICRQYGLIPNTDKAALVRIMQKERKTSEAARGSTKPEIGEAALMVRRSLRSGQRVTYEGHIIVLGDVNPGAEVISGGNVMVIGNCRGMVHAGAGGNRLAKVIARRLNPTSLSIAENKLSPEISKSMVSEYQAVRLSGQEFIFEKYMPGR